MPTPVKPTTPARPGLGGGQGWRVLAILSALMGCASISTDFYLPAMPAMGHAVGADAGAVEWTISGYLIGFSLGQLFWGPIGDRFGRRMPVAIGLVLFIVGSAEYFRRRRTGHQGHRGLQGRHGVSTQLRQLLERAAKFRRQSPGVPQEIFEFQKPRGIRQIAEHDQVRDGGERFLDQFFDRQPAVVQPALRLFSRFSASFLLGAVILTSSAPASIQRIDCSTVASVSIVSVVVMVCTRIG